MEDLFQNTWYGRYWLMLVMNNRMIFIVIAVVMLLVFLLTRISNRR